MYRLFRAGRMRFSLDARLLSRLAAILLLASPAQATVTTMAAFTPSDRGAILKASPQPTDSPSPSYTFGELNDFVPQLHTDYTKIFDVDPGPIIQSNANADVAQIALLAAATNLSGADRNSQFQHVVNFDLAANGLGPTTVVSRGKFSVSGGLDSSILRVFLLIFATVIVALAVLRWGLS